MIVNIVAITLLMNLQPNNEAIANHLIAAENYLKSMLIHLIELGATSQMIESVAKAIAYVSRINSTDPLVMRSDFLENRTIDGSVLKHLAEITQREG